MAKMRVHELAKELEIKSQEIIDSLSGTEYEIKSASNNIDDAAQEIILKSTKNPHQRQKKNLPHQKQGRKQNQRKLSLRRLQMQAVLRQKQKRRKLQMVSMTDQRKSPALQLCSMHSTANRVQDMEITEDRTREQKAADHRMADARQMTVVRDQQVRQNQRCPAMI